MQFECCGVESWRDWSDRNEHFDDEYEDKVPESCCDPDKDEVRVSDVENGRSGSTYLLGAYYISPSHAERMREEADHLPRPVRGGLLHQDQGLAGGEQGHHRRDQHRHPRRHAGQPGLRAVPVVRHQPRPAQQGRLRQGQGQGLLRTILSKYYKS